MQYYLEIEFVSRDFVVQLWCDLLTLMAVVSNPECGEEQIPQNSLLINITIQSVPQTDGNLSEIQRTRLLKLNRLSFAYMYLSLNLSMP